MGGLRERILAADDIESEVVDIPQWGVSVEVRGMTGAERAAVMQDAVDGAGNLRHDKLYPALLIATVHDPETGEKVFRPEDRDAINAKSGAALEALSRVAMRLSGIGDEAVEEAEKN